MQSKLKYLNGVTGTLVKDVRCDFLEPDLDLNIDIMAGLLRFMIDKSYTELTLEISDLSDFDDNYFFDRCIYKNYYFEFVINKEEKLLIVQNKVNPSLLDGSAYQEDGNFKKGYPEILGIKDLDHMLLKKENESIFESYLLRILRKGNFIERFCADKLLSRRNKLFEKINS